MTLRKHCRVREFVAITCMGGLACGLVSAAQSPDIKIVSSRADTVSGGDTLVQLSVVGEEAWRAYLNGKEVTDSFRAAVQSGEFLAHLTGLRQGRNVLAVRIGGRHRLRLEILNHSLAGPIFSGQHQHPFVCQTEAHGLGPPLDTECNAPTRIQYYYKSAAPVPNALQGSATPSTEWALGFKAYDPSAPLPADVAQVTTSDGQQVPYIVRRETGTINRAVYDIQFLHQPGRPLPTPWTVPSPGWNGRLVYIFDGGCGAGYRQGTFDEPIGAENELFLAQGYATGTSTLNVFGNSCNDRLSAETLSMVKERFIKQFGPVVHTVGWGDSGGAMQLYLTAQNYPGLLDGLIPYVAFPDFATTAQSITDCTLLDHALKTSKLLWTHRQKTAVAGWATWRACEQSWASWHIADSKVGCDALVPKDLIYDRVLRPKGVRCDIYDNEIEVFGRDPRTGFARRPLDNVGVQYGLAAFASGLIDAEHFVELNERIGGYDNDGTVIAARTQADAMSVRLAYQHGLVLTGSGGLSEVPIVEWRRYADDLADTHSHVESFVTRARLIAANGQANNQVILVFPRYTESEVRSFYKTGRLDGLLPEQAGDLLRQMNRWLDNIAADQSAASRSQKVVRDRPADLADGCWVADGEHIVEPLTYEGHGRCGQLYPPHATPRIAAGGPLTDEVLKCALKPIDRADYVQALTADQLTRLEKIFPSGVCDYKQQGVGYQRIHTTWQRF